jgi:hypothetical protein
VSAVKKKYKTKPKPDIALPDGDTAKPVGTLAKKFGMTERTFKKLGVPLTRIAGCLYGSERKAGEVLADRLNNPTKRTRGSRR